MMKIKKFVLPITPLDITRLKHQFTLEEAKEWVGALESFMSFKNVKEAQTIAKVLGNQNDQYPILSAEFDDKNNKREMKYDDYALDHRLSKPVSKEARKIEWQEFSNVKTITISAVDLSHVDPLFKMAAVETKKNKATILSEITQQDNSGSPKKPRVLQTSKVTQELGSKIDEIEKAKQQQQQQHEEKMAKLEKEQELYQQTQQVLNHDQQIQQMQDQIIAVQVGVIESTDENLTDVEKTVEEIKEIDVKRDQDLEQKVTDVQQTLEDGNETAEDLRKKLTDVQQKLEDGNQALEEMSDGEDEAKEETADKPSLNFWNLQYWTGASATSPKLKERARKPMDIEPNSEKDKNQHTSSSTTKKRATT